MSSPTWQLYDEDGYAMVLVHVRDGMGLKRLLQPGLSSCFVTWSRSPAIGARAQAQGSDRCLGVDEKRDFVNALAIEFGHTLAEVTSPTTATI